MFVPFIFSILFSGTVAVTAFDQGQQNPEAENFLKSKAAVVEQVETYGVDVVGN